MRGMVVGEGGRSSGVLLYFVFTHMLKLVLMLVPVHMHIHTQHTYTHDCLIAGPYRALKVFELNKT